MRLYSHQHQRRVKVSQETVSTTLQYHRENAAAHFYYWNLNNVCTFKESEIWPSLFHKKKKVMIILPKSLIVQTDYLYFKIFMLEQETSLELNLTWNSQFSLMPPLGL